MLKDPEKVKKFADTGRKLNKELHEFSETCKRVAEKRREASPYTVERIPELLDKLEEYTDTQAKMKKPLTLSGYTLAMGVPSRTFQKMCNGEYDYVIEEYKVFHKLDDDCTEHNGIPLIPFSEIMDKCRLLVQQQLEENCYTNRGNPAGSIFSLKCNYKWVEDAPPSTLNQTLVIADNNQALKAIEMLTK